MEHLQKEGIISSELYFKRKNTKSTAEQFLSKFDKPDFMFKNHLKWILVCSFFKNTAFLQVWNKDSLDVYC